MIFVDTGAWFATTVQSDSRHHMAHDWMVSNTAPLVTSDYVVDELVTLLKSKGYPDMARKVGRDLLVTNVIAVEYISKLDIENAWKTFEQFDDKPWSFTDCTSRVLMQRLGIRAAFAFDDDFRQFGTVDVVPTLAA